MRTTGLVLGICESKLKASRIPSAHAAVVILLALDVVFAEVASFLDFDDFQVRAALIGQAMPSACRNVNSISQVQSLAPFRHLDSGLPFEDVPMLLSVRMPLQGQAM